MDVSVTGEATRTSIRRMRAGEDTISVAGDVLRDCNADLFPNFELGNNEHVGHFDPVSCPEAGYMLAVRPGCHPVLPTRR